MLSHRISRQLRAVFLPQRSEIGSFVDELHYQSHRVGGFGAALISFVSTPYLIFDPMIHPEATLLPALRIGQCLMGLISLALIFLPAVQRRAMYLILANAVYIELSGALVAGLTGTDPMYAGAFGFVLLIVCLFPVERMHALAVLLASVCVYAVCAALIHTGPFDVRDLFGIYVVATAFMTTGFFIFILDRIRYSGFLKVVEIHTARESIQKLSEFAQKVNQSTDLNKILDEIITYVQDNFRMEGTLLQLYDRKANELVYFKTNFQHFHDEPLRKYVQSLRFPLAPPSSAGSILRRGKPMYFPNMRIAHRFEKEDPLDHFVVRAQIASALIVPLIVQEEPVGMLYFSNYHDRMNLNRHELSSIYAFCQQIAGAISSSSLLNEVQLEREKSERLLLNILPESVAYELKEKGYVQPSLFDHVTILFTDFKGFTHHAANMSPAELVDELDGVFGHFDSIAEAYGLEKLKTIGDSYMCVGGLPRTNATHPVDACLAALEMIAFMRQANEIRTAGTGTAFWEIRIGVHTGSVVAGVIGKSKFAYDIWGDAVNIASRMESSGESGRLNVSEETANLVTDFFDMSPRGNVAIKNRGGMEMYFVEGLKQSLLGPDGRPGPEFQRLYESMRGPTLTVHT